MFTPKICDFGESRRLSNEDMTTVGTADFAAPEMTRGDKYDEKVDVYSFGIMMAEMETHRKPYHGLPRMGLTAKILDGLRPDLPSKFKEQWPSLHTIMKRCWDSDPGKRPSMSEVTEALFLATDSLHASVLSPRVTKSMKLKTPVILRSGTLTHLKSSEKVIHALNRLCDECNKEEPTRQCLHCPPIRGECVLFCELCWEAGESLAVFSLSLSLIY